MREAIDIQRARILYDRLGTWRRVSEVMRRASNDQCFTRDAIVKAVRTADRCKLSPTEGK